MLGCGSGYLSRHYLCCLSDHWLLNQMKVNSSCWRTHSYCQPSQGITKIKPSQLHCKMVSYLTDHWQVICCDGWSSFLKVSASMPSFPKSILGKCDKNHHKPMCHTVVANPVVYFLSLSKRGFVLAQAECRVSSDSGNCKTCIYIFICHYMCKRMCKYTYTYL